MTTVETCQTAVTAGRLDGSPKAEKRAAQACLANHVDTAEHREETLVTSPITLAGGSKNKQKVDFVSA